MMSSQVSLENQAMQQELLERLRSVGFAKVFMMVPGE